MTVKLRVNYEAIQKACHLQYDIFYSINLCHTFSISLYHLPFVIYKK